MADLSQVNLGKAMAQAIGRSDPYSAEAVRRYEKELDSPGKEARRALAKVFGKTEQYIEFGQSSEAPENADPLLQQLLRLYGDLSADGRHAVLGYANLQHNKEHPGASPANPFPNARPPRSPLISGNLVGKSRQNAIHSQRARKK